MTRVGDKSVGVLLHVQVSDTHAWTGTHKTQARNLTHWLTRITSPVAWTTALHTEQLRTDTPRNTQRKRNFLRRTVYTRSHRSRDAPVIVGTRLIGRKTTVGDAGGVCFVFDRPWVDAAAAQIGLRPNADGCVDYHERKRREKVFGSEESEQYTASHLGQGRSSLFSSPPNWFWPRFDWWD